MKPSVKTLYLLFSVLLPRLNAALTRAEKLKIDRENFPPNSGSIACSVAESSMALNKSADTGYVIHICIVFSSKALALGIYLTKVLLRY